MSEMDMTPDTDAAAKKRKRMGALRVALIVVFACIFAFSAYLLIDYYVDSRQEAQGYKDLSQQVQRPPRPLPDDDTDVPDDTVPDTTVHYVTVLNSKTGAYVSVLPQYADLFSRNPDFAGWLQIPDTDIDYPVMHTPEDSDYYLNRNFYGTETRQGSIFADGSCDLLRPSENIILHGHHMRDGTMFGTLVDYKDPQFWQTHKYIFFDTLTETHTYEVIAVFIASVNAGTDFPYYRYMNTDEAEFESYVSMCKQYSLYDTGVDAVYGEKLLTLSTCEYTAENNRFVVVAKRID